MAYPPAALPVNLTDATEQAVIHADLHNDTGLAVADIVSELGPNPSGIHATVDTRIQYQGNRSTIGVTDHFTDFAGFIIQATSTVIALDGNGNAVITFPHPFHDTPIVLVSQGDYNGRILFLASSSPSLTQFTVTATVVNTGAPAANATIRANWVALSVRTS